MGAYCQAASGEQAILGFISAHRQRVRRAGDAAKHEFRECANVLLDRTKVSSRSGARCQALPDRRGDILGLYSARHRCSIKNVENKFSGLLFGGCRHRQLAYKGLEKQTNPPSIHAHTHTNLERYGRNSICCIVGVPQKATHLTERKKFLIERKCNSWA
jgi:hypothetical protein